MRRDTRDCAQPSQASVPTTLPSPLSTCFQVITANLQVKMGEPHTSRGPKHEDLSSYFDRSASAVRGYADV